VSSSLGCLEPLSMTGRSPGTSGGRSPGNSNGSSSFFGSWRFFRFVPYRSLNESFLRHAPAARRCGLARGLHSRRAVQAVRSKSELPSPSVPGRPRGPASSERKAMQGMWNDRTA
jgi:hypothetical protein